MDVIIASVIFFSLLVAAVVIVPTIKMAMDIAPFLYTNTRCSARSGLILSRKTYDSLLATTYTKELYAMLEDTAYGRVVEQANRFGMVSVGLEKDLFETYSWLENIMPEKLRPIIAAMKGKFEIQDLKEALQKLHEGRPIGELSKIGNANLRLKLEAVGDVTSFIAALEGTPYEGLVADSGERMATELDLQYMRSVLQTIDECKDQKAALPFREFWRRHIDLINIRLTLRRIDVNAEGPSLLDGGFIPAERLAEVTDKNQLAEALQETPYADIDTSVSGLRLEQEFHLFISEEGKRANAKHPLKGGPIVKYIIQKELETRNLNVLLKLKDEGFTTEEINALLVV